MLRIKDSQVKFTGEQENPFVHFSLPGTTKTEQIEQAKIILQRIN